MPASRLPINSIAVAPKKLVVEVLAIVDGATFVVRRGASLQLLKLEHVVAPELEQPYGRAARTRLEQILGGRQVVVEYVERKGCLVSVRIRSEDDRDLAESLLLAGLLWVEPAFWEPALRRAQGRARSAKTGLWRDSAPESPWAYRARRTMAQSSTKP